MQEQNDYDFKVVFYFCEKDGYCLRNFKTEGYPELRFYRTAKKMDDGFVLHHTYQGYDLEELYQFFNTRVSGISYKLSVLHENFDEKLKELVSFSQSQKKRVLLYCLQDFDKKELKYLQVVGGAYSNVYVIALENCQPDLENENHLVQQFFQQRTRHKKFVSMLKLEANEHDFIYEDKKEQIPYKKLAYFVKYYRKNVIQVVNDNLMNSIMTKEAQVITLFLRPEDENLLVDFKKMVYGNIKETEIVFAYHIQGKNKKSDYVGKYLKHKLGITHKDLPTLRAIQQDSKGKIKRWQLEGELNEHFMYQFYESLKNGELQHYEKSQLSALEIFDDLVSVIKPFDNKVFKGYIPLKIDTFVLIVEDENCEKSMKAIKEYEKIILQKMEKLGEDKVGQKMEFQYVSVLRADVEEYLPNEIPILIYLPAQKSGKRIFGSYFWIPQHFEIMIDFVISGESILETEEFLNLQSLQFDMGAEL